MSKSPSKTIADFTAPFGQQIELQDGILNDDVRMLRVRIRERSRFTVFDIDPAAAQAWDTATAQAWGQAVAVWADVTGILKPGILKPGTLKQGGGNDA